MGVVFEAFDEESGTRVAIKTLSRIDAETIYRFKNEFRSLAGICHPNICRLYDLLFEEQRWFIVMELVSGVDFTSWVRSQDTLDDRRLGQAILQLCDGIGVMHAAGKLHRDLKPSNVLVEATGRVAILDFGLVTDRRTATGEPTNSGLFFGGTPAYMAPEQAETGRATAASDLYAVGVMLYELLTGQRPFSGSPHRILAEKIHVPAPRVHLRAPDAPAGLATLCDDLLARKADERPSLAATIARIQAALGVGVPRPLVMKSASESSRVALESTNLAVGLTGRTSEMQVLEASFDALLAGSAVVLFVRGTSGIGKSTILSDFVARRSMRTDAVVFQGRCHEREAVPFKAFDALVDDMSRYLRRLPREQALAVLPRDISALACIFPVLLRVGVVAEAPEPKMRDGHELRRRAFAAFGELLARIGDRQPVCVVIDDLQWLDQDSVSLMSSLLVDRDPAQIMLIFSHRSERAEDNEGLSTIRSVAEANASLLVKNLSVQPLDEDSSRTLALARLSPDHPHRTTLASSIARESGGSPLFIDALSRHAVRRDSMPAASTLVGLLHAELLRLNAEALRMVEMWALAGRPLCVPLLLAVAGASRQDLDDLCVWHLGRIEGTDQRRAFDCYHDRVREAVVSQMSGATRKRHYRVLADALVRAPDTEPDLLAICFEGAGVLAKAAKFTAEAAAKAEKGMAFDRAAELFARAMTLIGSSGDEYDEYLIAMARSLAHAGRSKEAADAYLQAAEKLSGDERIEVRRRAAFELLTSGYAQSGLEVIRSVCREVDIAVPTSRSRAMLAVTMMQIWQRFTSPPMPRKRPAKLSSKERLRLDVAYTACMLESHHIVYGFWATANYLQLASRLRDSGHLALALAHAALSTTLLSPLAERRLERLFTAAYAHAEAAGDPAFEGAVAQCEGIGCLLGRRMKVENARRLLLSALERLDGSRGKQSIIDAATMGLTAVPSADLKKETRRSAILIEEAFSLRRLHSARFMAVTSSCIRLLTGDLAGVEHHLQRVHATMEGHQMTAWIDLCYFQATARLAFYLGTPDRVLEGATEIWPSYERSKLRRSEFVSHGLHGIRGVAALWVARRTDLPSRRRSELLHLAEQALKQMSRGRIRPYPDHALALRHGLALARGEKTLAVSVLRQYIDGETRAPWFAGAEALAAQRCLGKLVGGTEGDELLRRADAELRAMGVADVDAATNLLLPGCQTD